MLYVSPEVRRDRTIDPIFTEDVTRARSLHLAGDWVPTPEPYATDNDDALVYDEDVVCVYPTVRGRIYIMTLAGHGGNLDADTTDTLVFYTSELDKVIHDKAWHDLLPKP